MARKTRRHPGLFVQFLVMSRTHRPAKARNAAWQVTRHPGSRPAACALLAVSAAAQGASESAGLHGPEIAWLFVTVAFVASAVAFFAWGYLHARARSSDRAWKEAEPAPAAPRTGASRQTEAAAPDEPRTQAVLDALTGAALLVTRRHQGFVVTFLNASARLMWPHAGAGSTLESLSGLTPASRLAIESMTPGQAASFDGWRLAMLQEEPGLPPRVLVSQLPATASEGEIFGSTLSHDLRAPIRVVEGFTRIVKEDYGAYLDRVGNDHLERVLGAAARMNLMIDALLTMARLSAQPLARQPVDLSQLAHFVLDDLRRAGGAREVEVEIEAGLRASGDPTLLRLVLENLLGNAWKYTSRTEQPHIAVRATAHEGQKAFTVSDNGAGFDMRSADRLFGLFQRLHSANDFPGHGVGLASVRRIVRRHGGDIWAEGRPGQGATFTFTLG
jgi:signal transduction histidine kinase